MSLIHTWNSEKTEQSDYGRVSEVQSFETLEYDHSFTNATVSKTIFNNHQPEEQISTSKESNNRSKFFIQGESNQQVTTSLQNKNRKDNEMLSCVQDHVDKNIQNVEDFHNVPVSSLVNSFFGCQMKAQEVSRKAKSFPIMKIGHESKVAKIESKIEAKIEALEIELAKFRKENTKLDKLVKENEKNAYELAREKKEWHNKKKDQMEGYNMFQEERQQLKKERDILQKQMKLLLQLPSRKEHNEIGGLKEKFTIIETEHIKKESRWNLDTKRLRRSIEELTKKNIELHEEIRRYEKLLQVERDTNGKFYKSGLIVMESHELLEMEDLGFHRDESQEYGSVDTCHDKEKEQYSTSSKGNKSFLFPDQTKIEIQL